MEREEFWIAVTDLHESANRIKNIPDADKASGIIVTGDLTNAGDSSKAESVLERIAGINPVIHAVIGNMDRSGVQALLREKGMSVHARGIPLNKSVGLAGVGCSLPTPFGTPSEVSEDTLETWLRQAMDEIGHLPRTILATHNPPLNTAADRLANGRHVGSRKLREFIERSRPRVVVTGHIHEAVGEEWIGETKLINPGPLGAGGYALIRNSADGGLEAELCRIDG